MEVLISHRTSRILCFPPVDEVKICRGGGADGRREGGKKITQEKEVLRCSFKMKSAWKMELNVCTMLNINTNLLN